MPTQRTRINIVRDNSFFAYQSKLNKQARNKRMIYNSLELIVLFTLTIALTIALT